MVAIKERIKSIALIGLVLLALFLTQWILYDELFSSSEQTGVIELDSTKLMTIVRPQSYMVSFGGVSYTRLYDIELQERVWNEIRPVIINFATHYKAMVPIEKAQFVNLFSDTSLLLRMPLALESASLFSVWTNEKVDEALAEVTISELLLKAGDHKNLYIYDRKNEMYYRLSLNENAHDIGALITALKALEHVEYRKVSYRFSLENTVSEAYNQSNYELIPFQYDYIVPKMGFRLETFEADGQLSEKAKEIMKSVFGDRMDFVKQLRDVNGALIMMYGYGEKTLHFESDGTVEYNQKFDPSTSENLSFKAALAKAAGKLERFGSLPDELYLADYSGESGKDQLHRFYFNYKIKDYSIAIDRTSGYPIEVTILGNQVISIKKSVVLPAEEMSILGIDRLYSIDECIYKNDIQVSVYFLQDMNIFETNVEMIDYYYPIRSAIESLEMTYYNYDLGGGPILIPCWEVVIAGRVYLFDAHSGEFIKTYKLD